MTGTQSTHVSLLTCKLVYTHSVRCSHWSKLEFQAWVLWQCHVAAKCFKCLFFISLFILPHASKKPFMDIEQLWSTFSIIDLWPSAQNSDTEANSVAATSQNDFLQKEPPSLTNYVSSSITEPFSSFPCCYYLLPSIHSICPTTGISGIAFL